MSNNQPNEGIPEKSGSSVTAADASKRELLAALKALLERDVRNTCQHDNTSRGGAIWTICDHCDAMWADDKGGKPNWRDPPEWTRARAAINRAESGQ